MTSAGSDVTVPSGETPVPLSVNVQVPGLAGGTPGIDPALATPARAPEATNANAVMLMSFRTELATMCLLEIQPGSSLPRIGFLG
jgi:hypothetical protein